MTVWLDGKLVYKVGRSFNKLANHTKNKLNSVIQIWPGIHYQLYILDIFRVCIFQDNELDNVFQDTQNVII